MAKRPFNGSPTVDGYYTTFDSSEVHRIDEGEGGGGGSDNFSTAQVTLISDGTDTAQLCVLPVLFGNPNKPVLTASLWVNGAGSPATVTVPLYEGEVHLMPLQSAALYTVSGNATFDTQTIKITGDCTITYDSTSQGPKELL